MENVLEILDQKVGKGFFKLDKPPIGMVYNAPEMYMDKNRIIGVSKISENSLKSTFDCVYREKVGLNQFSKEIRRESKNIYIIKENELEYSRFYIWIALLILDREKTMVDIPNEPYPLRMYDDNFDIYLAPRVPDDNVEEVDEMSDRQKSVLIQLWDLLNDYFDLKKEGKYIESIKKMERDIYTMIKMIAKDSIPFILDNMEIKLEKE